MSSVRVHNFSVSLDGFGTGEGQSLEAPFGHAGSRLHEWFFPTRSFHEMQGEPGGSTGIDVRTVANRLGHASTSTTLDIYWAWVPARDRDAARHLEAILG